MSEEGAFSLDQAGKLDGVADGSSWSWLACRVLKL